MKYEGHTPGPWASLEFALSNEICARGNPLIAIVQSRHCYSPEELRANARLIAAAPDLLMAVNAALMHMIGYVNPTDAEKALTDLLRKTIMEDES